MPAKMMTIEENKKRERERERRGLDGGFEAKRIVAVCAIAVCCRDGFVYGFFEF